MIRKAAFWTLMVAVTISGIATAFIFRSLTRVEGLGHELLNLQPFEDDHTNANSPIVGIVNIGPGLASILTSRTVAAEDVQVESQLGDCFNESTRVTHSIVMSAADHRLGILLRYDWERDQYHMVGYTGKLP
jgi:hypothetical protein